MNWLAIILAGLATYASRVSFIAFGNRIELPEAVESALKYVAPAAFAAISIPIVLGGDSVAEFSDDIPRIVGATLACGIIWKTKNLPLGLITGMGSLWLLLWLL